MTGSSYFGVTQWQAALATPPHLVAIAPAVTATDYHDQWTYLHFGNLGPAYIRKPVRMRSAVSRSLSKHPSSICS